MTDHPGHGRSPIAIRLLSPVDWNVLRHLRLAALRNDPDAFVGDLDTEQRQSHREWEQWARTSNWFAAFAGDDPVGLVSVVDHPRTGELYAESMWVDGSRRGRGIAGKLLLAVEDLALARHRSHVFLWVLEGHDQAASVYRRHGFRETENRQPAPTPSLIMEQEFRLDIPSPTWFAANGPDRQVSPGGLLDDPRHDDGSRRLNILHRP